MALSGDGNTLAVGAVGEDGNANGAGAVYVFVRDGMGSWSQQAYVKASNTDANDHFSRVALSGDGNILAVGAHDEDSNASGVNPGPAAEADNSKADAGAVYVFVRDGMGSWSQQAYVKASNTDASDLFGNDVALSGDGNTLAVGAHWEDGTSTGIGGDQADDFTFNAGAVYLY